jgi:hypothetical protein
MRWNVNDIYQLYLKLSKKNQAGGISATDLFYYWNTEQNMYHQDIVGRWQARANGKTGINTGLIQNETILSDLAIFTIPASLTIIAAKATKPDDFIFRMAARINSKKVTFINPDQKASVSDSVIDPPSTTDNCYYGIEYEDYCSLLPATLPTVSITTMELDYVAACNDVKWGYTFDANDRQVYNPGTSVQPKWNTPTIITITKRALTNLGVSFKDQDFLNFGRTAQASGD